MVKALLIVLLGFCWISQSSKNGLYDEDLSTEDMIDEVYKGIDHMPTCPDHLEIIFEIIKCWERLE
jgi:hypothetical protein